MGGSRFLNPRATGSFVAWESVATTGCVGESTRPLQRRRRDLAEAKAPAGRRSQSPSGRACDEPGHVRRLPDCPTTMASACRQLRRSQPTVMDAIEPVIGGRAFGIPPAEASRDGRRGKAHAIYLRTFLRVLSSWVHEEKSERIRGVSPIPPPLASFADLIGAHGPQGVFPTCLPTRRPPAPAGCGSHFAPAPPTPHPTRTPPSITSHPPMRMVLGPCPVAGRRQRRTAQSRPCRSLDAAR